MLDKQCLQKWEIREKGEFCKSFEGCMLEMKGWGKVCNSFYVCCKITPWLYVSLNLLLHIKVLIFCSHGEKNCSSF